MRFIYLLLALLALPALGQEQFSVYFDSDKYELKPSEQQRLAEWMSTNKDVKVVGIHGFTDEDGTSQYNDTLARRRITSVFKAISGSIAIRDDFKTRSFGELHQQSPDKALNRKVTLFYLLAKDLPREEEILGIKPAAPAPRPEPVYADRVVLKNPNGSTTEYLLDKEFMKSVHRAKAGEKLKVDNLNFQINTFAIMPESRAKLYELLMVMQGNPNLKIEIQGHLCCMPHDRLDLSTQRARAVYQFLIGNKIEKSRLSYKGFGSTQPIYPIPEKNEEERAANRRVEILIVENP